MLLNCPTCHSSALLAINTYKRVWHVCHSCGDAFPVQKERYSLSFLPDKHLKKMPENEESMYDYFIKKDHIDYSVGTAHEFIQKYVHSQKIELKGKKVLDVSGGNGHFLMEIAKLGADVSLTEINRPTIDYVKSTHNINAYYFNFNNQSINNAVDGTYDVIMARAAIMFCKDLARFAEESRKVLLDGGLLIVNHSVIPTLGVFLRVQLDEFSYFALRQPENVVKTFEHAGYTLEYSFDETDPSLYVYDHDLNSYWAFVRRLYEKSAVRQLVSAERRGKMCYSLRARDRRRSTMIFRKF